MQQGQFIGIEAGGTKFVLGYGTCPDDLQGRISIPTEDPETTMKAVVNYIKDVQKKTKILAIGAAVFGPMDPNPKSPTFGYITTTPKLGWTHYNFVGRLKQDFDLPVGFDTDVNVAAMAEYTWGAAQGLSDFLYITVGTGIGAGGMVNGQLLHGHAHPEMGHILIPHDKQLDPFEGVCPYHKDCLEGLASGPAMKARWKVDSALDLADTHKAWDLEAHYLGVALSTYTMCLAPQKIVMGGGVMRHPNLIERIKPKLTQALGGYIKTPAVTRDLDRYISLPGLVENSGVCGAIALAKLAYNKN